MSEVINTSGWKPTGHRVLVRVEQVERKTESGIIIADITADKEQLGQDSGIVVELGNTAYSDQETHWCKVGDYVKFGRYAGQLIRPNETNDEHEYRVLNDLDIVLTKEKVNE
jgi:co-chaperonin GroES (HSP10)